VWNDVNLNYAALDGEFWTAESTRSSNTARVSLPNVCILPAAVDLACHRLHRPGLHAACPHARSRAHEFRSHMHTCVYTCWTDTGANASPGSESADIVRISWYGERLGRGAGTKSSFVGILVAVYGFWFRKFRV
jgi:hypothetical protein